MTGSLSSQRVCITARDRRDSSNRQNQLLKVRFSNSSQRGLHLEGKRKILAVDQQNHQLQVALIAPWLSCSPSHN